VNDETYIITLTSAGLERSSRVASVAFNPLQRYLAVGTRDGIIAMWQFMGDYQNAKLVILNNTYFTLKSSLHLELVFIQVAQHSGHTNGCGNECK